MKDLIKRNWWKLLRENENVNKLRSLVDFGISLNYNFELRTFPISTAHIIANGGNWVKSRKDGRVLESTEEWHHVSSGRRERESTSLAESRCPKY